MSVHVTIRRGSRVLYNGDLSAVQAWLDASRPPRFVIFASYGNDSIALIQWAHEQRLEGVTVVYSDTGWATADWSERVDRMETWVRSLGFAAHRTKSIGFSELARQKKGFPTQRYQWCSYVLKIEPGIRWLAKHDPQQRAICLVGARRAESKSKDDSRATFPEYLPRSENHGGRFMLAPFAHFSDEDRDAVLKRAGVEPLPHRSRECKCVNSNRADFLRYTEDDIGEIEALESEIGKTMFRPKRHMGAKDIREVIKWAQSDRGKYEPPHDEDMAGCNTGFCEW